MTTTIRGPQVMGLRGPGPELSPADRGYFEAQVAAAELAATTVLAVSRYFPSKAAGEAGSTTGQLFSTNDGAGSLIYYERTSGGSVEKARAVTPVTLANYASLTGAQTITNKTFAGAQKFVTNGGRIGITSAGTALSFVEGIVHLVNEDDAGVCLLVTSKWQGSAASSFTNNDNALFTTYNDIVDDSTNFSWSLSANNAYNNIPVGVTDGGTRVGVLGWATSVAFAGYVHEGILDGQYGLQGAAGFQGPGSGSSAETNVAVGVRGIVYSDSPGATIHAARGGVFASDGGAGIIEDNVAVYARAQNGTTGNYSFFGELGKFYNFGQVTSFSEFSQSSSAFSARKSSNSYEFGVDDAGGFGSNIGATASQGYPFLAFNAEADPTGDTFQTRGKKGAIIYGNTGGALIFARATNANAATQTLVESGRFDADGHLLPGADSARNLGNADLRWDQLFAVAGTINTSDERLKTNIGAIPDAWLDAWGRVGWSRFKFVDGARWHAGLVAQRVHAVFADAGIDAFEIGLCCFDQWDETTRAVMAEVTKVRQVKTMISERVDEVMKATTKDGQIVELIVPGTKFTSALVDQEYLTTEDTGETEIERMAGDRWGLRYDECQAFEAAWQRRRGDRLETAVTGLTARLDAIDGGAQS